MPTTFNVLQLPACLMEMTARLVLCAPTSIQSAVSM